jgi:hypothetical protein
MVATQLSDGAAAAILAVPIAPSVATPKSARLKVIAKTVVLFNALRLENNLFYGLCK